MRNLTKLIAAAAAGAALFAGGISVAADTATQISVEPAATLMPGQNSPFDAAGVKAIRRGKPIPAGYRLVGQKVTTTRGAKNAGASLFFVCPGGKRLKTFGDSGGIGFGIDRAYVDHRQTWVHTYGARKKGTTETGIVYAVCK